MPELADRLEQRLTAAQNRVERVFLDQCTIHRDEAGLDDDVLNETSGVLEPPTDDEGLIYTGRCAFLIQNRVLQDPARDADQHAAQPLDPHYEWRGPLADVPVLRTGDLVTCTASRLDPLLVGRVFRVSERPGTTSFAVLRVAQLEVVA